jgi:hypothetical protein
VTVPEIAAVVDMAVDSRNRNFRCIWSTKCANINYPPRPDGGEDSTTAMSTTEAFRKTLICDVGETLHLIRYPDIQKPAMQKVAKLPQVRRPENVGAIDEFAVEKFAMSGSITRKKFNAEIDALNLIVEGTRFCRRIGREHRSNHIYIYISCRLEIGTMVQKCTDPDCLSFQSEAVEIPMEFLEELRREYAPGQVFSSQKVKTFNVETVDIEEILAEYWDDTDCLYYNGSPDRDKR